MTGIAGDAELDGGKMFLKFICKVSRMISVSAFFLILSTTGLTQAADITINGTQKFQTMDGFGVNANSERWNNGELTPALDTLIDTMGATNWRVVVESLLNWETTNDNADPFTFNWTYYNTLYRTPKFQDLWGILGYLKQKNVNHITLSVMGCLPSWMGGCTLNTGTYEAEWVEMITSLLYYARNTKNLRIDSVSGFNEPDWGNNEGPAVDSTQYVRVLRKLITRMDALGLGDIKIVGPDCGSVSIGKDTYMPAMLADSQLMGKVNHFGFHSYYGDSSGIDDAIKASAYPARNYWMTEFSAWCSVCDQGGQPPDDWTFGSDTFDYLYNHIIQGAASAQIWEGYDSYYEHHNSWSYWGLLGYNQSTGVYTPRKRMYINAHVFKYVEPGAVRISAGSSQSGLTLLAFSNPITKRLTIVGKNFNSTALTINGTLIGLSPVTSLKFYQTTQNNNFTRKPDIPVNSNTFSAQAAANSFFTLTGALEAQDKTPPTAPTGLAATAESEGQINLSWSASTDDVGVRRYKIECCAGGGCNNFIQIGTTTKTTYNDTGLQAFTKYRYRVRARDAAGNLSGYSTIAAATTLDTTAPTAPAGLTAKAVGESQINLSWSASTDNVVVTRYKIERCKGVGCSNFIQIGTATTTTYSNTGLQAFTKYRYRVRARDAAGNVSGYSNMAGATTLDTTASNR